ncbi:MAG: hypothetical protein JRI68_26250 [Deltaproteobacteria bacterium]|nr:hypothetical protein [Deltaproteobacteria bacterium]
MRATFLSAAAASLVATFAIWQSSGCFPDATLISGDGGTASGTGGTGGSSSSGSGGSTGGSGGSSSSGTGGQGGDGGSNCDHCPGEDTTCGYRVCESGCDMEFATAGTTCTENGGQMCDGSGHCIECLTEQDCTEPGDQCISNWCGDPTGAVGDPCDTPADCLNGNCPQDDKICCDFACDSPCVACTAAKTCGTDGTCAPIVAGTDPDSECTSGVCFGGSCEEGKIVFVTSTMHDGNFNGLAGADAMCATQATAGCLPGTYLAWMSTATDSPSTRFTQASLAYRLVDGTKIADNWNDLVDNSLDAPINLDEIGDPPPQAQGMSGCDPDLSYTGTDPDGTPANAAAQRCSEWTTTQADATWGKHGSTSNLWSHYCTGNSSNTCTLQTAITCFEQ